MTDTAHAPPGRPRRPQLTLVPEQADAEQPRRLPILEIARYLRGRPIVRAKRLSQGTKTLFLWELTDGSVIALLRDTACEPYFKTWSAHSGPIERLVAQSARELFAAKRQEASMGELASLLAAEPLELPLMFEPERVARPAPPAPAGEERPVDHEGAAHWSPEDEVVLHGVVLERALKALTYRNNADEKRDVLRWIFKPDVVHLTVRGRLLAQHQDDMPFSFRRCCKLAGYDADALRDALRGLLRRRGIEVPGA